MRSSLTPFGTTVIVLGASLLLLSGFIVYRYSSESLSKTGDFEVLLPEAAPPQNDQITLGFVGDIMVHTPMAKSLKDESSATYNFDPLFSRIKAQTLAPDIMVGNLETPVTGDGTLSGYPNFDAPIELLDALKLAGFDVLQITNNHSLDQGVSGLESTIKNIHSRELLPVGGTLYPSEEYKPMIQSQNGIMVAFIAATFGFNGYQLPPEKSYLANLINIEKITTSIQHARTQGADVVIIMPHFGTEYQLTPSEDQKQLVDALVLAGADAIIGTHPHVVQPTEERIGPTGNKVIVAFSLGNFISNQQDKYTDLELMVNLTYERDPTTKKVNLKKFDKIPLYLHKYVGENKKYFEVVLLREALASPNLTTDDIQRIQDYNETMNTQFEPATPVPAPTDEPSPIITSPSSITPEPSVIPAPPVIPAKAGIQS